jgi:hypothetical protein
LYAHAQDVGLDANVFYANVLYAHAFDFHALDVAFFWGIILVWHARDF